MTDLEARVARLELLVGASPAPRAGDHRETVNRGIAPLGEWVRSQAREGQTLVFAGFGRGKANAVSSRAWQGADPPHNLKVIADLCGALASEQRLGILRELTRAATEGGSAGRGRRTTAELTAALKLDRGQLYHHLKDLFVQGLVKQPERGAYEITHGGVTLFTVSAVLPDLGRHHAGDGPSGGAPPDDLDLGDGGSDA